ncbi:MAG: MmgE/PrpD family protein [Acidiferrobacterales bacterium]
MTAITRRLAEFVAQVSYEKLPIEVQERAKWLVTDIVGIALRARQEAESTPSLLAAVSDLGLVQGKSTAIGDEHTYSPVGAALINGTCAHSLDFDDTHAQGSIHSSAPIVPAAFAAAEVVDASGRDVIAGIVAGFEVQLRLSLALIPKDHYDRGFHPTATCGAFGAAAAAARVFGLSADQVESAFGICLSQAAGSLQYLVDGAWTKRFNSGWAAVNGLTAASLARSGFKGPVEAFEGKWGFLRGYAPSPVFEKAIAGLGDVYETMAIGVKPYPACRYSHAALDALRELRAANNISANEIESVEIGLPHTGWKLIGDPEEHKQRPQNVVDGQFSMPFVAAVALREGNLTWEDYARHIGNRETLVLCQRIKTVVDPQAEAEFPENMSGVARAYTRRGTFEKFVRVPKGEPGNFVTMDELRAKFDGLVAPYLSRARRDSSATALLTLEQADDVSAVLRLTRPDQAAARKAAAGDD